MRPRVFVEPEAEADLQNAVDWYEARTSGLGSEFLRAVRTVFALIERNPDQFPRARETSVGP
jgi:plasmid stabilization system protein ParE